MHALPRAVLGASIVAILSTESKCRVANHEAIVPNTPSDLATSGSRVKVDSRTSAAQSLPARLWLASSTATPPPIEWPKITRLPGSGWRRTSSPQALAASALMLASDGNGALLSPQPRY